MALITHEDKPDNVEDEVTDKVTRTVEGQNFRQGEDEVGKKTSKKNTVLESA